MKNEQGQQLLRAGTTEPAGPLQEERIPERCEDAGNPAVRAGGAEVMRLFAALDRECSAYCVLGGYETLPESPRSDIDIMVPEADFKKLPRILSCVGPEIGMPLVQFLRHETSACFYVFALAQNGFVQYLQVDPAADYRRHGRRWMAAAEVITRRRRHPNGFWIPGASDAFIYYLIKRVDKRSFIQAHGEFLSKLYQEDPCGCDEQIKRFWPAETGGAITKAAETGDWSALTGNVGKFADELMNHGGSLPDRFHKVIEFVRRVQRVLRPTGMFVACLGPDGAGKSTVVRRIQSGLGQCFRRTDLFHLRPRILQGTSASRKPTYEPHALPNRGLVASIAKLLFLVCDYQIGYWTRVRPLLVRSSLVVFDRYFHDLTTDSRRFRYGGPAWMVRLAGYLVPQPDLVLLFDAPGEVIRARKQELPADEIDRQLSEYRRIIRKGAVHILDAAQPVDAVTAEACGVILSRMEARTRARLGLEG